MGQPKNFVRHLLRLEFSSFVFFFSALTLLCVAFFTFESSALLAFYDFYVVLVVLAALLSSAAALAITSPGDTPKTARLEFFLGFLIFLFGLALGLYRIDFFSIWLDEEVQANLTFGWNGMSIVYGAATSQQMPLSYFFTALSWNLLGLNELALRLPSCLFMAASGPLFYRITKCVCANRLIYSVAPFIYLLCPWLIRYSQEGRGYGCLIFCCLLWMNSAYDLLITADERGCLNKNCLLFFSSTLLLLLSTSLQPVVFAASFLPAIGILCLLPNWRRKAVVFGGTVMLSLLVAAPLIRLAQINSQKYFHQISSFADISRPLSGFFALPSLISALFVGQSAFFALTLVSMPLTATFPIRKKGGLLWVGVGVSVTFLASFIGLFALLINYQVSVRYYLIFYPLGLLTIIAYFDQLAVFFDKAGDRYLKWLWQAAFLAALMAPSIRSLPDVYFSMRFDRWNVDLRVIYDYFRRAGQPKDLAYVIPYQNPDTWEQNGFLGKKYYYPANGPVTVKSTWEFKYRETVSDQILEEAESKETRQVFLAFFNLSPARAQLIKYCSSRPGVNIIGGDLFLICNLTVTGSLSQALESFFSGLIRAVENKENAYRIFDILLRLAEQEKNFSKCQSYLADLKNLKSSSPTIQGLVQLHEKQCQAAFLGLRTNR